MKLSMKYAKGQGMTEYIIIVALIAVAAIGIFKYFGNTVRAQAGVATAEIGGQSSTTARTAATTNSTKGVAEGSNAKTLSNFETSK